MPTPFESATLNLRLYELRREPLLREARAWWLAEFHPTSFADAVAIIGGPRNAWFRMVMGYWDMAASLVTGGAIDAPSFLAAHGEVIGTYALIAPFVADIRERTANRMFLWHIEQVLATLPERDAVLANRRSGLQAARVARATARTPSGAEISPSDPTSPA